MNEQISPRMFTLSAFIVGYLLIDDLDSSEQNALGSWFMLLGQTLCTNASSHFVKVKRVLFPLGKAIIRKGCYIKRKELLIII